tara:strand:- start:8577 stop:9608 length:1032 start_codon:yes stop_codon:yes gene_type:complete
MEKIYFYPQLDYTNLSSPNPYIVDFQRALSSHYTIANKKSNQIGVLDFFKYLFKADIYIFNWIEDLPIYKYGKIQILFFLFFLIIAKLINKKIIWVLHNKYSHFSSKNSWTDFMYSILMKYSDLIVTHSREGISFTREKYPAYVNKVKYINHPIRELLVKTPRKEKEYDFLIWGNIQPYKGIREFLKFLKTNHINSVKILIVGKCIDNHYKKDITSLLSNNVTFKDGFFSLDEIAKMACHCEFILFVHNAISVLSSGALIDSIRMGVQIIGPHRGAFKDLSTLSFINTYKDYEDILLLHKKHGGEHAAINAKEHLDFFKKNTWETFGNRMHLEIDKMNGSDKR